MSRMWMVVPLVTGSAKGGTWWESFILKDWRVRVFGPSGLVDILSNRLYVRTINLYKFMERRYH